MGPLTLRCFSIVNTTVLHIPEFVESSDVEPRIQRNQTSYMEGYLQAIHQFSTVQKVSAPNPIVQGSTVYYLEQPQSLKITFSVLKKKKLASMPLCVSDFVLFSELRGQFFLSSWVYRQNP